MIIPGDGAGDLINQRSPEISQSNLKNPFKNLLMKTHALLTEAPFIQLNEQQVSEVALTLVAFGLGRRWRRRFFSGWVNLSFATFKPPRTHGRFFPKTQQSKRSSPGKEVFFDTELGPKGRGRCGVTMCYRLSFRILWRRGFIPEQKMMCNTCDSLLIYSNDCLLHILSLFLSPR